MDEEKAQQMYGEFLQLQQEAETLNEHFRAMQEQLATIEKTRQTMKDLQTLQKPSESWVSIAPGAYVKAITQPLGPVLLNIGANVAVEKTPEQVLHTLDEHAKVLNELSDAAIKELQATLERIETIKNAVEQSAPPTTHEGHNH